MISRFVRIQLTVFAVLAITAFVLIAFVYVRVPALLGIGQIEVTADFANASGLYPNANVTYNGHVVGRVTDVGLVPRAVRATMLVDEDQAPPANSRAEIHSVSPIGEQFVDLRPQAPGPPLADGATIPQARTSTPASIASVLDDANKLLAVVKPDSLRITLDEASAAFRNVGPDLGQLIDNTKLLVDTANQNYAPTEKLIKDADPFLATQASTSPNLRSWTQDLKSFSAQVAASDEELRGVLDNVPDAAEQAQELLSRLSPTTPKLLRNADVLTKLAKDYNAPIEQILVVYPMFQSALQTTTPDTRPGSIGVNLTTTINQKNCTNGWIPPGQPGGARGFNELADERLPTQSFCRSPQSQDIQARSSRYLPCFEPGSPAGKRAPTIYSCRGWGAPKPRPGEIVIPDELNNGDGRRTVPAPGKTPFAGLPVPRDLSPLGVLGAPDTSAPRSEDPTWQGLLLPTAR